MNFHILVLLLLKQFILCQLMVGGTTMLGSGQGRWWSSRKKLVFSIMQDAWVFTAYLHKAKCFMMHYESQEHRLTEANIKNATIQMLRPMVQCSSVSEDISTLQTSNFTIILACCIFSFAWNVEMSSLGSPDSCKFNRYH